MWSKSKIVYPIRLSCGLLQNGDSMRQKEFHELYLQTPPGFSAELIGGVVFVREPTAEPHSKGHMRLGSLFDAYGAATRGVEAYSNATVMLSPKDEVQPDVVLRILPDFGGQSKDVIIKKRQYIDGAPELIAEVAHSSRAIDLHSKRRRYARGGVLEYLVVCLDPLQIHWFDLHNKRMIEAGDDNIFRSHVFPGLWVHSKGLLELDYQLVMDTLKEGLSSDDHAQFVQSLANRKGNHRID